MWGVGNKKVFCLRARKFRLKDARTSFIHMELIRLMSSLIVINSSYEVRHPCQVKTRETLVQTTATSKVLRKKIDLANA